MKTGIFFLLLFFSGSKVLAQDKYELVPGGQEVAIPFELINNLIILDVEINQVPLKLIFDTGVKQTILINLKPTDSLHFRNLEQTAFSGVGNEKTYISGFSSSHNFINLHRQIRNKDAKIYVITGMDFHFSESIGINVNGFIGGELIKDYIVKIDYKQKKIFFYRHENFNRKKLKRYRRFPLQIVNDKPYVQAWLQVQKNMPKRELKFLIDTGNSDDIWVFAVDSLQISAGQKRIDDYFGLGFSGEIEGQRIKIYRFGLDKKMKFKYAYTGLPGRVYFEHIIKRNSFDGIIGNEVLRRFFVVFDYRNQEMYLKKYYRNYRDKFLFNNTGIHLAYDGKIPVKVQEFVTQFEAVESTGETNVEINKSFIYKYEMQDKIVIKHVRKNSPADRAGLLKGDILLEINGESVYPYRLDELEKRFFYHTQKHLEFLIERYGMKFRFKVYNTKQL